MLPFFLARRLACSYPWRVTPQIPKLPVAGNPLDSGIWSAEETPGAGCIVIKECEYEGSVRRGLRVIIRPDGNLKVVSGLVAKLLTQKIKFI